VKELSNLCLSIRILNFFRVIASCYSFSLQEADNELGQTGAAGLASVETLDDSAGELKPIVNEDGMETVRLDGEDGADGTAPGPKHSLICITAMRKHMVASGTKTHSVARYSAVSKMLSKCQMRIWQQIGIEIWF